jgi:hypothetical protein
VVILTTCELILGVVYLSEGVGLLGLTGLGAAFAFGGFLFVALLLLQGLFSLLVMNGAWKGQSLAWTLGIALSIIGLIFSVFNVLIDFLVPIDLITIGVNALILYTLTLTRTQEYFGVQIGLKTPISPASQS